MTKLAKVIKRTATDQVVLCIKDEIESGKYQDGDTLPPVTELAKQYGVGISTIREALRKLEAIELIKIVHGRGSFVQRKHIQWEAKFASFSEIIRKWGKVPGARLLKSATISADDRVAAQLNLPCGSPVHFLRRLRLADNEPIAIENSYLPAERFPNLLTEYKDPMSLYQLLEIQYGTYMTSALQTVRAELLVEDDRELLGAAKGEPALVLETIAYDFKSVPVEYGLSIFKADKYRYVVHLSR